MENEIKKITDSTQALINSLMPLLDDGMERFDQILADNRKEKFSYFEVVTRIGAESSISITANFPTYSVLVAELELGDKENTDD